MRSRHPSRQRLQRWLETGEPRRVDRHVDECLVCQEMLEELSALDEELVAGLQAATRPPEDLTERTRGGVDDRLRDEAAVGSFLELFAVATDLVRTVLDPTTERDGAHPAAPPADEATGGPR